MQVRRTPLLVALVAAPALAEEWRALTGVDEWGEPGGKLAVSPWVEPVRPLGFPYEDVTAILKVEGCDSTVTDSLGFFSLQFSDPPNLTGGEIEDGYTTYDIQTRWNGSVQVESSIRQNWADNRLSILSADRRAVAAGLEAGWLVEGATVEEQFEVLKTVQGLDEHRFLAGLANNQSVSFRFPWYGEGGVVFRFPLNGARAALEEAGCPTDWPD